MLKTKYSVKQVESRGGHLTHSKTEALIELLNLSGAQFGAATVGATQQTILSSRPIISRKSKVKFHAILVKASKEGDQLETLWEVEENALQNDSNDTSGRSFCLLSQSSPFKLEKCVRVIPAVDGYRSSSPQMAHMSRLHGRHICIFTQFRRTYYPTASRSSSFVRCRSYFESIKMLF